MTDLSTYGQLVETREDNGRRPKNIFAETALYTPSKLSTLDAGQINIFSQFEGYWKLDSIDDWQDETVIYIYADESGDLLKAKFYHGLQDRIRELNSPDKTPGTVMNIPTCTNLTDPKNPIPATDNCSLEILGTNALRFFNWTPVLSSDSLASTFTLQSTDPNSPDYNVAYAYFWSDWDGTSDNPAVGYVETMTRFVRVTPDLQIPPIQPISGPFPVNYMSARNAFEYARDYYLYMTMPQKAVPGAWPAGSIANYQALADQIEDVGVTYTVQGSVARRGGKYIGIWRTKYSAKYPVTTFHTDGFHHFNIGSKITVTGLLKEYAVLNGVQTAAAWPT